MNAESRWVIDVNVFVSAALFSESLPARAVFCALACGDVLVSEALLDELEKVLGRSRFNRYLSIDDRELFLGTLLEQAKFVAPTETIDACRDAADNHLLELAVAGVANAIVTGDRDLLVLNPFRGIEIVTPAAFLMNRGP